VTRTRGPFKDLVCPVCGTRSVPFWGTFRLFGPFATVQCTECGTRLRHSPWGALVGTLVLYLPMIVVGLALLAIPYVGIPLLIVFCMGLAWLEVRVRKLKPVKGGKQDP